MRFFSSIGPQSGIPTSTPSTSAGNSLSAPSSAGISFSPGMAMPVVIVKYSYSALAHLWSWMAVTTAKSTGTVAMSYSLQAERTSAVVSLHIRSFPVVFGHKKNTLVLLPQLLAGVAVSGKVGA